MVQTVCFSLKNDSQNAIIKLRLLELEKPSKKDKLRLQIKEEIEQILSNSVVYNKFELLWMLHYVNLYLYYSGIVNTIVSISWFSRCLKSTRTTKIDKLKLINLMRKYKKYKFVPGNLDYKKLYSNVLLEDYCEKRLLEISNLL
jgi:hypothetical protein